MSDDDPLGDALERLGVPTATVLLRMNDDGSAVVISNEGAFDVPPEDIAETP